MKWQQLKVPGGHKLLWTELNVSMQMSLSSKFFNEPTINIAKAYEEQLIRFTASTEQALRPLADHIMDLLSDSNGVREMTMAGNLLNNTIFKVENSKNGEEINESK